MKKIVYFICLFSCSAYSQCFELFSLGSEHVTALDENKRIWAFGRADSGQMGFSSTSNILNPIIIQNENIWKSIHAGAGRTFAIKNDGTLWATGANNFGMLGNGSTTTQTSWIQIGTASNWKKIAASSFTHTVGLKEDGTLWGWGQNDDYELGQGQGNNNLSQLTPIQIGSDNYWVDVDVTVAGTLAVKNDGTLWGCGQVGVLVNIGQNVYVTLTQGQFNNCAKISTGGAFILAQKFDGTLWAWGQNNFGQLGMGNFDPAYAFPFQISTDTWKDFAAGSLRSYGIKTDGTLWAWGRNQEGQLGDGTLTNRNVPTQIGTDNNWERIYAKGATTTVGVKADGSVWVWGNNNFGQFGNGTLNVGSNVPLQNTALCTLSTETPDHISTKVSLWPNPARDILYINYNELPLASLEVFDLNGRTVYHTQTIGLQGSISLPVTQWSRGVYLIRITTEQGTMHTEKVVLEK